MPALPKKFKALFINKIFFPEYDRYCWNKINNGRCYEWAYYAYCLWGTVKLWQSWRHAWVQVGDEFFDSESVRGCNHYNDLPCNLRGRQRNDSKLTTIESFKEFWNENGRYIPNWELMVQEIKNKDLNPVRS